MFIKTSKKKIYTNYNHCIHYYFKKVLQGLAASPNNILLMKTVKKDGDTMAERERSYDLSICLCYILGKNRSESGFKGQCSSQKHLWDNFHL